MATFPNHPVGTQLSMYRAVFRSSFPSRKVNLETAWGGTVSIFFIPRVLPFSHTGHRPTQALAERRRATTVHSAEIVVDPRADSVSDAGASVPGPTKTQSRLRRPSVPPSRRSQMTECVPCHAQWAQTDAKETSPH